MSTINGSVAVLGNFAVGICLSVILSGRILVNQGQSGNIVVVGGGGSGPKNMVGDSLLRFVCPLWGVVCAVSGQSPSEGDKFAAFGSQFICVLFDLPSLGIGAVNGRYVCCAVICGRNRFLCGDGVTQSSNDIFVVGGVCVCVCVFSFVWKRAGLCIGNVRYSC